MQCGEHAELFSFVNFPNIFCLIGDSSSSISFLWLFFFRLFTARQVELMNIHELPGHFNRANYGSQHGSQKWALPSKLITFSVT